MRTVRTKTGPELETLLNSILEGGSPEESEIRFLLRQKNPEQVQLMLRAARYLRKQYFSNRVFLYGSLGLADCSQKDRSSCQFKKPESEWYFNIRNVEHIVEAAQILAVCGVHLIELISPGCFSCHSLILKHILQLVRTLGWETNLPILVSPSICDSFPPDSSFEKEDEKYTFPCSQDNFLCALIAPPPYVRGQNVTWPQMIQTPAAPLHLLNWTDSPSFSSSDALIKRVAISVTRLCFPDKIIPARTSVSTDIGKLKKHLDAGANAVCYHIPLTGRKQQIASSLKNGFQENLRASFADITSLIQKLALTPGTRADYSQWIQTQERYRAVSSKA